MGKTKLGRGLASLTGTVPAILATNESERDAETSAALRLELGRYSRQMLDYEREIELRRDQLRGEHLARVREIIGEQDE